MFVCDVNFNEEMFIDAWEKYGPFRVVGVPKCNQLYILHLRRRLEEEEGHMNVIGMRWACLRPLSSPVPSPLLGAEKWINFWGYKRGECEVKQFSTSISAMIKKIYERYEGEWICVYMLAEMKEARMYFKMLISTSIYLFFFKKYEKRYKIGREGGRGKGIQGVWRKKKRMTMRQRRTL